ncbi:MAG: aldo/keto reductase [Victivallaceae bacterium]|nr:aldo/keto reductase [Victivallaceae bacterium]
MNKIQFGSRSGLKVNPVSIGAMRLPDDVIDSVELIRNAIDNGLVYIDTCRCYGESEFKMARALKDGYREKVILSTKSSPWNKKIQDSDDGTADSIVRRIEESLVRLDVDHLDFYQIWSLFNEENWKMATRKGGMLDGIKKARDMGLVKHIGITTHEKPEDIIRHLPEAGWIESILLSYNLMQRDYEPVIAKAHELGIGTIVMNPCGGGKFAGHSDVLMKIARAVNAVSVPDLAIRYVNSNPNIDTMLCGIGKKQDVSDTVTSVEREKFTPEQIEFINKSFDDLSKEKFCTGCNYCMPCPAGINIPGILNLVYEDRVLGFKETAIKQYNSPWIVKVKADACTKCGQCETKCTQKIKIIKELQAAHKKYNS